MTILVTTFSLFFFHLKSSTAFTWPERPVGVIPGAALPSAHVKSVTLFYSFYSCVCFTFVHFLLSTSTAPIWPPIISCLVLKLIPGWLHYFVFPKMLSTGSGVAYTRDMPLFSCTWLFTAFLGYPSSKTVSTTCAAVSFLCSQDFRGLLPTGAGFSLESSHDSWNTLSRRLLTPLLHFIGARCMDRLDN